MNKNLPKSQNPQESASIIKPTKTIQNRKINKDPPESSCCKIHKNQGKFNKLRETIQNRKSNQNPPKSSNQQESTKITKSKANKNKQHNKINDKQQSSKNLQKIKQNHRTNK